MGEHLHSARRLFLEMKETRSRVAILEAQNLELTRKLEDRDRELSEVLMRQGVLEERSSDYDQLRSWVEAGDNKIDELTAELARLDAAKANLTRENADLTRENTDLVGKVDRAVAAEASLSACLLQLQATSEEQQGIIERQKAVVICLSMDLSSSESSRNEYRKKLEDLQSTSLIQAERLRLEIKELKEKNSHLNHNCVAAVDKSFQHLQKVQATSEKAKRYRRQLGQVYRIRNRAWIQGFY